MSIEEFVGWFLIGATREAWRNRTFTMTEEQVEIIDIFRTHHARWRLS